MQLSSLQQKLTRLPLQTYLIIFLFFLAFLVRFWRIEYIPFADDGDEMAYIFAGQSLLEKGEPISWSSFNRPIDQTVYYEVQNTSVETTEKFTFVRPWFDHLFLVPVVIGSLTEAFGYHFPSMPPTLLYRLPMLVISLAVLYLVFKISEKLFGRSTAVLTFILLAFSPAFLLIQRMVVAENFILVFLLLTYYWYLLKKPVWLLLIPTLLAASTKVTGLVIIPIICVAFCVDKKYKEAIIYSLAGLGSSVAIYLIYGLSINITEFINGTVKQSHRLLGWSNPAFLFSHPGFYNKTMLDFSYYLILLLGLSAWFLPQTKESKFLLFLQTVLFAAIWATSAEQDMLGWYKIIWFVVVGLSAGLFLKQKNYSVLSVFIFLTCLNNIGLIRYPTNPLPDTEILRIGVASFVVVATTLLYYISRSSWKKNIFCVMIGLYILQAFYISNSYFASQCKDRNCPTPLITVNSLLKK